MGLLLELSMDFQTFCGEGDIRRRHLFDDELCIWLEISDLAVFWAAETDLDTSVYSATVFKPLTVAALAHLEQVMFLSRISSSCHKGFPVGNTIIRLDELEYVWILEDLAHVLSCYSKSLSSQKYGLLPRQSVRKARRRRTITTIPLTANSISNQRISVTIHASLDAVFAGHDTGTGLGRDLYTSARSKIQPFGGIQKEPKHRCLHLPPL